jgi:hypothetical protein
MPRTPPPSMLSTLSGRLCCCKSTGNGVHSKQKGRLVELQMCTFASSTIDVVNDAILLSLSPNVENNKKSQFSTAGETPQPKASHIYSTLLSPLSFSGSFVWF